MALRYVDRGHEGARHFVHALGLGGDLGLLTGAPGNARPSDGPYICIIPVLDYWRMAFSHAKRESVWHYSEVMEPELLEDIRKRRCALVFDMSNEGPDLNEKIFRELFAWMEQNRILPGTVVWLAQNRALQAKLQAWAGDRGHWVTCECYDFFVKAIAALFSPSAAEKVLEHGPEEHIQRVFDPALKDRLLLCLNATPRVSRVLTISALIHFGILDEALVSFPGMSYVKEGNSFAQINKFIESNPSLNFLLPSLLKTICLSNLVVDSFGEEGNSLATKVDPRPYERTFFSLVTETNFSDGSIERVTEKIVKPFCLGHPTLVVGNPYSIRFMMELGFQEWEGVIDRSYDAVGHPAGRFITLFDEVRRQVRGIRAEPGEWLGRVREVGAHNVRHAASGNFLSRYQELYDRQVVERLSMLVAG
jgi:hypothetical protein